MSQISEYDPEDRALDALIVSVLRSRCGDDVDGDRIPELTPNENAALQSLGPDFPTRLLAGDWIARRLRRALDSDDPACQIIYPLEQLLREVGGKANAIVQTCFPRIRRPDTVLKQSLMTVCRCLQDYEASTETFSTWFLRIVCRQCVSSLKTQVRANFASLEHTANGDRELSGAVQSRIY